jgi:2'-5' RNA ligase
MSQKYVIAHMLSEVFPTEFPSSGWPLHITVVGNFAISYSLDELRSGLTSYTQQTKPFEVESEGEAMFGPNNDVEVSLIKRNDEILRLHNGLLGLLDGLAVTFDTPGFMGDGYRPHATIQDGVRLHDNQLINVDSVSLVDMFPDDNVHLRSVIETYLLSGKAS